MSLKKAAVEGSYSQELLIFVCLFSGTVRSTFRFKKMAELRSVSMNNVIYLVGLVVVVGAILSFVFH
jgi:hypothetical protein